MATVLETLKSAYRRSGLVAAGVNLNQTQTAVGLERLQALYRGMLASGLLGLFTDVYLEDDTAYEANEQERVYNGEVATVTFPVTVLDDITGKTRAPRDGAAIVVVNPDTNVPVIKIYDAVLVQWQSIESLTIGVTAPMTHRYDNQIKDLLAVDLLGETPLSPSPKLVRDASLARLTIGSRYDQPRKPLNYDGRFM